MTASSNKSKQSVADKVEVETVEPVNSNDTAYKAKKLQDALQAISDFIAILAPTLDFNRKTMAEKAVATIKEAL